MKVLKENEHKLLTYKIIKGNTLAPAKISFRKHTTPNLDLNYGYQLNSEDDGWFRIPSYSPEKGKGYGLLIKGIKVANSPRFIEIG